MGKFGTKSKYGLEGEGAERLKSLSERLVRWQFKQIDLLSSSISLIFTISIAFSGFLISLFKEGTNGCIYYLIKRALCLLALSSTLGMFAIISRIIDFRLTKNTVKARRRFYELENDIIYESKKQSDKDSETKKINSTKSWSSILGDITWILFFLQVGLLILTLWTIVLSI